MRSHVRRLLILGLLARPLAAGAAEPCELPPVARVVAVGDVHGEFGSFVKVLQMTGLVDAQQRWAGGTTHLVQTGDVLDRGPDSRKALELLIRLEKEASKAGGRVHALLGNHEVMNMLGDLRYVSAAEYEAFRTKDSEKRRERHLETALEDARRKAGNIKLDEAALRADFMNQVPLGFLEHREAFAPAGRYGRWLRDRLAVVKIGAVVFLHGGLTPESAALGCAEINARVRNDLGRDFEKTRETPLASFSGGENGPLWFRGLAREDETTLAPKLDAILAAMKAKIIVGGHNVTGTGRIETRASGRVVMIDAGMFSGFGGHLAALEIGTDGLTAVYPDRRVPLPGALAPATSPD